MGVEMNTIIRYGPIKYYRMTEGDMGSMYLFGIPILCFYCSTYFGWVSMFDRVRFNFKRIDKHPLLFSQRYGYTAGIVFKCWYYSFDRIRKYAP